MLHVISTIVLMQYVHLHICVSSEIVSCNMMLPSTYNEIIIIFLYMVKFCVLHLKLLYNMYG
jgi:hypothetical protein